MYFILFCYFANCNEVLIVYFFRVRSYVSSAMHTLLSLLLLDLHNNVNCYCSIAFSAYSVNQLRLA